MIHPLGQLTTQQAVKIGFVSHNFSPDRQKDERTDSMCKYNDNYQSVWINISWSRPVRDHCFRTCCPSVPTFQSRKTKQQKTMFATGVTVGLAKWIIDNTCLVISIFTQTEKRFRKQHPIKSITQ